MDQVTSSQAPVRVPQNRFGDMDSNDDGVITRTEWRGSDQSFRVHDWNRDGVLSGDEIRIGARRPAVDEWDYDPSASDDYFDWSEPAFARLDRNRDGRVSRNEWYFNSESFYRADRNRDNVLTRAEFLGADVDDDREDRFEYMDLNRNNRIERGEWHGSAETFEWLDRNNNGSLSRGEVGAANTNPNARNRQFQSLDANRDGALNESEWYWSRRSFRQRDLNGDGVITRREFNQTADTAAAAPAPVPTQSVRVDARQAWTNTGILVRAGDLVTLQADGTIGMSDDPSDTATPAGSVRGRRAKNAPFSTALAGGLIARVANSEIRFIGERGTFTAPVSGVLYLGINDDHMPDNSGEFRVTVSLHTATR